MNATGRLASWLQQHPQFIRRVVDFDDEQDKLCLLNLTKSNTELSAEAVNDAAKFSRWVNQKLADNHCRYGIGGYMELRTIYDNREQFETDGQERRNLHLGVDIWAGAGTPVYAPLTGKIHSFQDNNHFGDYGPTIILEHDLDGLTLYSLYGHLSRENLVGLSVGQKIKAGELLANFGRPEENGSWPPHLHFQLMLDMDGHRGDYPGACKLSEKEKYVQIIPDPGILLGLPEEMVVD
jgi:murein DD-endopeptidase MepM/ murein hydrolase activator NlpD